MRSLWDLLLPPRCAGCSRSGAWYCNRCLLLTRRIEEPICRRCGKELAATGVHCSCRLRHLHRLRAAAALDGPMHPVMHRFKYEGWRQLATPLASLLEECCRKEGIAAGRPVAVAVPLHSRREKMRGFNQSQLLLDELRRRVDLRVPRGRLERCRETPTQVGLDRTRRLGNLERAFRWSGESLGNQPVIVVDDVSTTGATIDACAQALKDGGAGLVTGLTVARVGSFQ